MTLGVIIGACRKKWALSLFFLSVIYPSIALSEVIFYDAVALKGQETMLKAETRGTFLGIGGEVVTFVVDGKSIGKNLSGQDGFAVKRFIPTKSGLHKICVKCGDVTDNGVLLALDRKGKIVFIDVEGSLLEGAFAINVKPGSAKAVKKIHKKYPIIFLQKGLLGVKALRSWLKKNDFPQAPVLPWRRGDVFGEIREGGLKIKAIIGGAEVIESAESYKPLVFSFDSVEGAEVVENWGEIEKKLK